MELINYRVTNPVSRMDLLHVLLSVLLEGGLTLQRPYCLGKEYFTAGTSKKTCNKTLRLSG